MQVKLEQSIDFLKMASQELVSTDVQFFTKPRIENLVKKIDCFVAIISHPEKFNESSYVSPSEDTKKPVKQLYMVPPNITNKLEWEADVVNSAGSTEPT